MKGLHQMPKLSKRQEILKLKCQSLLEITLVLNLTLWFLLLDLGFRFEMAEFFKTTNIFGVNQELFGLKNIN